MADNKAPKYAADDPRNADYQKKAREDAANVQKLQTQIAERDAQQKMNQYKGPGYEALIQSDAEKKAGVMPPGWKGMSDVGTGELLDRYKINPFAGEASQKLRTQALSTGPSDYANSLLDKQKFEESQARGTVGLQTQQANSNAMSNLARTGGLGGGARTSLARSSARDALMANQNVGAQGALQRYGINSDDMKQRQDLLGKTADVERQGDLQNIQQSTTDLGARAQFDANRYNQQMSAWAAKQSADATRAAGGGGGKK